MILYIKFKRSRFRNLRYLHLELGMKSSFLAIVGSLKSFPES